MEQSPQLLTVKQFAQQYPAFSESSLRWLIHRSETRKGSRGSEIAGNGLAESGALLRAGRKVIIRVDRFFDWLDHHNRQSPS